MKQIINRLCLCVILGTVVASTSAMCEPANDPSSTSSDGVSLTNDIKIMIRSWSVLEPDLTGDDSTIDYRVVLVGIGNTPDPVGIGKIILQYSTGRLVLPDDQYFVQYLQVVNKVINGISGQAEKFLSRPHDEQAQLILELSSQRTSSASEFQKPPVGAELKQLQDEMTQYRMAKIIKERLETLVVMHFVNRMGSEEQDVIDSWATQAGILDNDRIVSQLQKNGIGFSSANATNTPAAPAPEDD